MKAVFLGAVSTVGLGVAAGHAADWNGPYAGGNAGAAILDGDATITNLFAAGSGSFDLSDVGFTFGGQIGWNFQYDQFVFGLEGDFNYLDVDDGLTLGTAKGPIAARADYDWFATVRGRAGMTVDNMLIYITGGVAFMDSDLRISEPALGGTASDSDVLVGGTIGGGVEYAFDRAWSAKLEYLYANFESHSLTTSPVAASIRVEPELHVIRIGVNYNFCTGGAC